MPRIRTLAITMAALGVLSGLSLSGARACDNDRYPCPIVSQTEDAAGAAARSPAPARKKASRTAAQDEKPRAKSEAEALRTSSRTTKVNQPAGQEQTSASGPQKSEDPAPAPNEGAGEENPVAAGTAGSAAQAAGGGAPPVAAANEVRVVDPNELNELDLAATSAAPRGSAESSWLSYLLMTLGGALAAASTVRFLFFV
jgi:hypothetical protein